MSEGISCLLSFAEDNPAAWKEIFRTVHCHRCDTADGLKHNAWKKSKYEVPLELSREEWNFLASRVKNVEGVDLEDKGPVNRAVISVDKAIRCAIDWAVTQQETGASIAEIFAHRVVTSGTAVAAPDDAGGGSDAGGRLVSWAELQQHATPDDCWIGLGSTVYDLTSFSLNHPGGSKIINMYAGRVATQAFEENHPLTIIRQTLGKAGMQEAAVGQLDPNEQFPPESMLPNLGGATPASDKSAEVVAVAPPKDSALDALPRLEECMNLFDYELVAQKKMALTGREKGWAYYSSGGDDEVTLRDNMSAFQRIYLKPRVLRDVSTIDTSSTIMGLTAPDGEPFSFPVYLSSVALQKLGHPDGELAWIRAVVSQRVNYLLPTLSSYSYDEMFALAQEKGMDFMFQLYMNQDRELVQEMLDNAQAHGCKAVFLTVDAPQLGRREKDLRMKTVAIDGDQSSAASVQTNQEKDVPQDTGTASAISSFIDPSLNWKDVEWIQSATTMDIVLKGIQCAEDAVLAKRAGVKGIVVSNHGTISITSG